MGGVLSGIKSASSSSTFTAFMNFASRSVFDSHLYFLAVSMLWI